MASTFGIRNSQNHDIYFEAVAERSFNIGPTSHAVEPTLSHRCLPFGCCTHVDRVVFLVDIFTAVAEKAHHTGCEYDQRQYNPDHSGCGQSCWKEQTVIMFLLLFISQALYTQIYTVILYKYAIVSTTVYIRMSNTGNQHTLTMFDIQDTILYTPEFKLNGGRFFYAYYIKYMFPRKTRDKIATYY